MSFYQPFEVTAFHSCDRELALRLLNGTDELRPSNNPWDWLGPGIYFWEQNPHRALIYAEEAAMQQQKFNGKIKTPFVIGAVIELGKCPNLIETMPVNKGANRQLDCAVMNCLHKGANFTDRFHIEICVRNPAMIKSYYLPRPVDVFSPYLRPL